MFVLSQRCAWSSGFRRKVATVPNFLVAKPQLPVAKLNATMHPDFSSLFCKIRGVCWVTVTQKTYLIQIRFLLLGSTKGTTRETKKKELNFTTFCAEQKVKNDNGKNEVCLLLVLFRLLISFCLSVSCLMILLCRGCLLC